MQGGLLSRFVHTQPFPRFVFNALSDLKGSWEAATGWRRSSIVSSTSTKLQVWEDARELMQRANPRARAQSLSQHRWGQILYLTPCMLQHACRAVLIKWLHSGMKLLLEEIKLCAQVNTAWKSASAPIGGGGGGVHYAEMKRVSAARAAGSNTSSYSTRVQDISCYIATIIWTQ